MKPKKTLRKVTAIAVIVLLWVLYASELKKVDDDLYISSTCTVASGMAALTLICPMPCDEDFEDYFEGDDEE